MRNIYAILLSLGFIFIALTPKAYGSHAMGADLTYRCLGNNQYEITLKFYRDCDGVAAPASANVSLVSGCTGQSVNVTLQRDPLFSFLEVTPLCPPLRQCSKCNPNPPSSCPQLYPGVEVYTYRDTVTLPSQCNNWNLSYTLCCRNSAVTNLQSPGSQSMYINAVINNANGICNSSPVFSELPTPYICNNQLYNYNHGVIEPDGDSVVYELINPMTTGGASIPYSGTYTVNDPMSTSTGIAFNRFTGQLSMVPNQTQHGVMVVRVSEYRNGVLVGQCIRDIQVVVINCTSNQIPPALSNYQNPGGGGYIIDTVTMGVCPGNLITFDISGSDGNAMDSVFLTSNFDSVFSGGTYTVAGTQNPNKASFSWTPTSSDIGTHYFVVTARDNHCPTTASETKAYAIQVLEEVTASPDQKFCNVGGPVRLEAQGGSLFHWRPRSTIVAAAPDSSWIHVLPNQTTTYTVTSDCNRLDSVTVEIVPSFTYTLTPDDSICRFDQIALDLTAQASFAPYDVTWSPDYRLDTNGVFNVIAQPFNTTTYTVELISKDGCRVVDSVEVVINGERPRITATPDKSYLCRNDSDQIQMDLLAAPAQCGPTLQGCTGMNKITAQIGAGTDLSPLVTPFHGSYDNFRMQILYKKEDLQNLGLLGGTISELAFNVGQKLSTNPFRDFYIRIGCTELNELPFKFDDGLTTVFGPSNVNTVNGWNNFQLTTEYDWDGFSNLIVEVCFTSTGNFNDFAEYSKTSYTSVVYRFDDFVGPGCDLTPSLTSDLRPNLQLKICSQPLNNINISWTPTTGVSNPNIANPIISGLNETTEYTIVADYNGCIGTTEETVFVDSTQVLGAPDTLLCDTVPLQLNATAIGTPPPIKLTCGANGTPLVNPVIDQPLGNGSESFNGTMFLNGRTDMKFQMLLRSADLLAAGIRSGTISTISLDLASKNSNAPAENFQISIGCTEEDQLSSQGFEPTSAVVYSNAAYNTVGGWNDFTLTSPFDWDGTSNLVIQICWDNDQSFIGGTDNIRTYDVNYNAMIRTYGNDSTGCNLVKPKSPYQKLPNLVLGIAAPPPGTFDYQWTQLNNGSSNLNVDTIQNPIASPNEGNTLYEVQIETEFGCFVYDTVVVNVNVLETTVSNDTAICRGNEVLLNATGGATYEWNPITDLLTPDSSTTLATPVVTTPYTVTIYDSSGCVLDREVTITVNDIPVVDAGMFQSILIGEVVPMNATGGSQYDWRPPSGLSDPTIADPNASPVRTTTYTVVVTDSNGCVNTDTVTIEVTSIDDVFIPTAFSPNGDGNNDLWYVMPIGLTELERLEVYNRWGTMVFSADDLNDGWDGTFNGEPQPMGTYVYVLIGRDYVGEPIVKRGNITLLR